MFRPQANNKKSKPLQILQSPQYWRNLKGPNLILVIYHGLKFHNSKISKNRRVSGFDIKDVQLYTPEEPLHVHQAAKKLRKTALEMCFDILKNDSTSDKQWRIVVVEG